MSLLSRVDLNPSFPALAFYREQFGIVPDIVLAQALLPRLIEADRLMSEALCREGALTRAQKELIHLAVAVGYENRYEAALRCQMLRTLGLPDVQLARIVFDYRQADLPAADVALLDFSLRLGRHPTWINPEDVEELHRHGLVDQHLVEATLAVSWSNYRCILSTGLGTEPDFEPPLIPPMSVRRTLFRPPGRRAADGSDKRPYARGPTLGAESFAPFAEIKGLYGFVPNVYLSQTLRPDIIEAEIRAADLVLRPVDALSKNQKEYIFLSVSAANLNSYCVAIHCEVLRGMGVSDQGLEQIAIDHHHSDLSAEDRALLDVCLKMARRRAEYSEADVSILRQHGFSDAQILESAAIVAIAHFFNTLDTGLGAEPDFTHNVPLDAQGAHPFSLPEHLTDKKTSSQADSKGDDPDAVFIKRVQAGDAEAFEELVRRHGRRVYRTLAGILRQTEDIEDAVQDTFVKAFEHIGTFESRSRFSTWLTRIAINTGLQRVRGRKEMESLDESPESLDKVRPRRLQAWHDNPEQSYSKTQVRALIMDALMRMPLKYRVAVMLRDLQQLSTAEAAEALGLGIPALKARLFRGRLMLREALAPHFERKGK